STARLRSRTTSLSPREEPAREWLGHFCEECVSTAASADPDQPAEEAPASGTERRALVVASGAHALHDGYTDLVWIGLPIWQAEFGLSYAAVGMLRMIYTGTMASLQIPASHLAERIGGPIVLALRSE